MKKIPLSKQGKNKGKYFAIVDDNDFNHLNQWNWLFNNGYAQRIDESSGKRIVIYMHRIVLNPPPHLFTDHINHNTLDNRKKNLRACSKQENAFNIKKKKSGASRYKGVSLDHRDNIWVARIGIDTKRIHLGRFKDEIEAAKAYDKKAKELFGEFVKPNFTKAA